MPAPALVRASEHSRVALPAAWNTADVRERLEAAALRTGVRAFEIRGRQLHALGAVGVITLGGLTVEITPKTEDGQPPAIFLSELLRFSGAMPGLSVLEARVAAGERSLLEIILGWAAREAASNIREGLPRRYEAREELTSAVRGRIEMRRLATRRPGREFELHVRHAPLTDANPLTRILQWLLEEIATRTALAPTRQLCQRLLQEMPPQKAGRPNLEDLDRIVLMSSEGRWQPLLAFAALLLRQIAPDPTRGGGEQAVAVLFTLHDLFERVLRRVFRDGLGATDTTLVSAGRRLLRSISPPYSEQLSLRPDFMFRGPDGLRIGDAKWKRILSPDGQVRLGEADAYQLATYLAVFNANAGYIFCPLATSDPEPVIAGFQISGIDRPLHVTGVHLPTLIAATPQGATLRAKLCALIAADTIAVQAA